jgi:hypothetical protein
MLKDSKERPGLMEFHGSSATDNRGKMAATDAICECLGETLKGIVQAAVARSKGQ